VNSINTQIIKKPVFGATEAPAIRISDFRIVFFYQSFFPGRKHQKITKFSQKFGDALIELFYDIVIFNFKPL